MTGPSDGQADGRRRLARNTKFTDLFKSQAEEAVWQGDRSCSSEMLNDRRVDGVFDALDGMNPADEIEAMLMTQLLALHNATMFCLGRAMDRGQSAEMRRDYRNQASRLARAFDQKAGALARYRGKGQQQINVKHVHVNDGGQAIVGVVDTRAGVYQEKQEAPYATDHRPAIAHRPEIPMRSADSERDTVPVGAGSWEAPLPDVWGRRR